MTYVSFQCRWAMMTLAVFAVGVVMVSCGQPVQAPVEASAVEPELVESASVEDVKQARILVEPEAGPPLRLDVSPPPLVAKRMLVLDDEAVEKATMSLEEVTESLAVPQPLVEAHQRQGAMDQADAGPAESEAVTEDQDATTPLAAQRLYFKARTAMRERRSYDAIRQFEAALKLDPNEPRILRSLAEAYSNLGNPVRAAAYYQQLVEVDPQEVSALYALGRLAMDQRRFEEAVGYLQAARQSLMLDQNKPLRSVMNPLVAYRLGESLRQLGYGKAALEQFTEFLTLDRNFSSATPMLQELAILDRQQPAILVAVGDLYNQLDAPGQARAAYERAQTNSGSLAQELLARQLYTMLRLKQDEQAVALLTQRIDQLGAQDGLLALVRYLTEQGISSQILMTELNRLYENNTESPQLLRVMADILPKDKAVELLTAHLKKYPSDLSIYDVLIWQHVLPDNLGAADQAQRHRAIDLTLDVMAEAPVYAGSYATRFVRDADDPQVLRQTLSTYQTSLDATTSPNRRADLQVLRGLNFFRTEELEQAIEAFDQALALNSESTAARLQLIKLLINRGRLDRAGELLEQIADLNTPEIIMLRADLLFRQERLVEASELLREAIRQGRGGTASMSILLAQIQLREGDAIGAEQTLLRALDRHPTEEQLYRMLLALYMPGDGSASKVNNAAQQMASLQTRLFRTLPNSKLAKLLRAREMVVRGQVDRAEALLQSMLRDDADDMEAVRLLMQVYLRFGRTDDAEALFLRLYEARPNDREVLFLGLALYQQLENQKRIAEIGEKLLLLEPASEQRSMELAQLYIESDQAQKAVRVLDEALAQKEVRDPRLLMRYVSNAWAMLGDDAAVEARFKQARERFGDMDGELAYMLAQYYHQREKFDLYERKMVEALEQHPTHAGINNDLGYRWTVLNKNLEQARNMIRIAVDADPQSGPYLDSMGWVEYKLGNFDDAVTWLRRAANARMGTHPVIYDHLGDALYRAGDKPGALSAWRDAQNLLDQYKELIHEEDLDADTRELYEILPQKIKDAQAGQPVKVAEVPGFDEPEAQVE